MIPRIIHQTWKTTDIPEAFLYFQRTWQIHHPGWEYRLWTDVDCRDFIKRHYPEFLGIYYAYLNPICRVDAFRYFLLKHYGGVYADLDFECLRSLVPLLEGKEVVLGLEPASHVLRNRTISRGLDHFVCNALIASQPRHPFWDHVVASLVANWRQPGPLDATGPFFLTRALASYQEKARVSVLPAEWLYPADLDDCREGRLFDLEYWRQLTRNAYAIHHWVGTWWRPLEDSSLPCAEAWAKLLSNGRTVADTKIYLREFRSTVDMPRVSCLMTTRNWAPQALGAIRCFQEQTYPARELIILDTGEDNSLERWLADQGDGRIRYCRGSGHCAPPHDLRHQALALANGEYVCWWNDDDLYDPARIETQLAVVRALGADACLLGRRLTWWPRRDRLAVISSRTWDGSLLCAKTWLAACPAEPGYGEDMQATAGLLQSTRVVLLDQPRLYLAVEHQDRAIDEANSGLDGQVADLVFEREDYFRVVQELGKRLDLQAYLRTIGHVVSQEVDAGIATAPGVSSPLPLSAFAAPAAGTNSSPPVSGRSRSNGLPSVLILTPIKNAARFIPIFFKNLLRLDYPREKLSLAFLEGDSDDATWPMLRENGARHIEYFARVEYFQLNFSFRLGGERWLPDLQFRRRSIISKCRNALFKAAYRQESWILWIDADVIDYPSDVLRRLLDTGKSIVVPHCVQQPGGQTFDLNTFRYKPGARARAWRYMHDGIIQPPRGQGRLYLDDLRGEDLVELDAVGGTMLLVKAGLHAEGLLFPDYSYRGYLDTEGFAMQARDRGEVSWGMPDLEIIHATD